VTNQPPQTNGFQEKCGNCLFSKKPPQPTKMVLCRRNPPTPMMLGMQQNPITKQAQPLMDAFIPAVADDNWCGEWRAKRTETTRSIDLSKLNLDGATEN
jgi:hypothetical protein